MTWRVFTLSAAVPAGAGWLALVGASLVGLAPDLAAPGPERPAVTTLRQRAARHEAERSLWQPLADHVERDTRDGQRAAFWLAVANSAGKPVALRETVPLRIGAGLPASRTFVVEYRLWLVPLPGRVLLFGSPAKYLGNPVDAVRVYEEVKARLEGLDKPLPAPLRQALANVQESGPLRYPYLFRWVFRGRSVVDPLPTLRLAEGSIWLNTRGQDRPLRLPAPAQLEGLVGRPPALPSLPGPKQLYLAVNWCATLGGRQHRQWLLAELQNALRDTAPDELSDGGIHLHGKDEVGYWPVDELQKGRWPKSLPAPHEGDHLGALTAALHAAAETECPSQVSFLTWDPEETVQTPPEVAQLADRLSLQVIQVFGKRRRCLERLAGPNYFCTEYRPEGPPSLVLLRR